ncbi:N-carbamoyl-D-amino-acid hydrolase [Planosporangium thailandense]|uniref:N-carbamoyl-D-amino-acid hydrolase n=1 Tax=Planosporangium thailandense TaxID=765197 RepID=A0ABX0Y401_9ACTN|nr:N-carbamoyl-D-amino-acid hydrolase [Planosporangium thailandense]NJC73078.1 N-carbamoyl-D-amino-acid hydrolase [Planosporangium thailandense]
MRIAVAQVGGIQLSETRRAVVGRLANLLEQAADQRADLVVFPELTLTTFFPRYWYDDAAEADRFFERSMPGDDVAPLFELAADRGVAFYLGYAEIDPRGRRFNTSILVDRSGRIVGKYRKIHLPGHAERLDDVPAQHAEKRYFEVGDLGFGVFDVDGVKVGMCLCNDRRWPEVYRCLSLQGAEVVVLGYNTPVFVPGWQEEPHAKMFTHLLSLQAGAYQNSVWVAAAAKCGYEDGHHMIGGSAIVAPSGEIVAKARSEGEELIVADVDLGLSEIYRTSVFNFAAHRRPEHYRLIVDRVGRGEPVPVSFDQPPVTTAARRDA